MFKTIGSGLQTLGSILILVMVTHLFISEVFDESDENIAIAPAQMISFEDLVARLGPDDLIGRCRIADRRDPIVIILNDVSSKTIYIGSNRRHLERSFTYDSLKSYVFFDQATKRLCRNEVRVQH